MPLPRNLVQRQCHRDWYLSYKFEELKKRRTKDWEEYPELKADWESHEYSKDVFVRFLERPYRFYRNDYNEWMKGYNAKPK